MIVAVTLAGAVSYTTTPIAVLVARRLAFYDVPVGYKGHRSPTPYLGGAAVMTAFAIALVIAAPQAPGRTLSLLAGVAVMFAVGTIDDRRTLPPQLRVAIEFALGALLAALGHGWHLGAGAAIDAAVNGVWVVAVVNAFNLFDNMDGAASTMGLVAAGRDLHAGVDPRRRLGSGRECRAGWGVPGLPALQPRAPGSDLPR